MLQIFNTKFTEVITASSRDDQVVAFKSIACYRTGLDIAPVDGRENIEKSLHEVIKSFEREGGGKTLRLAHKSFNDNFVRLTLDIATKPGQ